MALSFFGLRVGTSKKAQEERSNDREESIPPARRPSPSRSPEPARPIPIPNAAHRHPVNPRFLPDQADIADSDLEVDWERQQKYAVSGESSNNTGTKVSSSFQSSDLITGSSSKCIGNTGAPTIFESAYPKWHSYPPIIPTPIETSAFTSSTKNDLINPIDAFLQESIDFKNWVGKKNAERIELRRAASYEKLVDELHKYQRIYEQEMTPRGRAVAKEHIFIIKEKIVEERRKMSAADLQHIRDIEDSWISLVSIDKHEQDISRKRQSFAMPKSEKIHPLSRVESLFGSDGSGNEDPSGRKSKEPWGGMPIQKDENTRLGKPHEIRVPEWFHVLEDQRLIRTVGNTTEERYLSIMNYISRLEFAKTQREYKDKHPDAEGLIVKNDEWDKEWHEPNPGWRHEHQRKHGGLWKCRKGPTAPDAENECTLCSGPSTSEPQNPAKSLEDLLEEIARAMAVVAAKDKEEVLERFARDRGNASTRGP